MHAGGQASGSEMNQATRFRNDSGLEQNGPPWLVEPGWNYRRPITITNNGAIDWSWYQVLVRLDGTNFDFNLANSDGSDLRFTMREGTILIPYWIESWDSVNELAYVWVRVPLLDIGDTTIYLYHNNPDASPASDGDSTFDGFEDDWEEYPLEPGSGKNLLAHGGVSDDIQSPFSWMIIEGAPYVSTEGYLILNNGTGIKSTTTFQNQAVGFKANYGPGNGNEWIGFFNESTFKRVMVGDSVSNPTNLYLRNFDTVEFTILIPPVGVPDWHGHDHIYEARWCNLVNCDEIKSIANIDHSVMGTILTNQVPTPSTLLPITLHNDNTGATSTLLVDWVYVRQYSNYDNSEPTVSLGAEQGLVELGIGMLDKPDALPAGEGLSYQLTISNTAEIDALGVIVTDTLPTNVQFVEVSTSHGSCFVDVAVICDMNTILANSWASITLVVTPTLDGTVINIASVGSPGYELNPSDNTIEEITLVDSVPPVMNWESPVHNEGTYISYGGLVLLEASATDNDQLWWNSRWDHVGNSYGPLGLTIPISTRSN
jgi:uncharacterized repeat protein (TIGR01451 family)